MVLLKKRLFKKNRRPIVRKSKIIGAKENEQSVTTKKSTLEKKSLDSIVRRSKIISKKQKDG